MSETLLVVEDEPDSAEFVTHLLESHGADVVSAASAREALEAVVHARPGGLCIPAPGSTLPQLSRAAASISKRHAQQGGRG